VKLVSFTIELAANDFNGLEFAEVSCKLNPQCAARGQPTHHCTDGCGLSTIVVLEPSLEIATDATHVSCQDPVLLDYLREQCFALRSWLCLNQAPTQLLDLVGSDDTAAHGLDRIFQLEAHAATKKTVEVQRSTDPLALWTSQKLPQQATPRQRIVVIAHDLNLLAGRDREAILSGRQLDG
jgi:hypothetical protein